MEKNIRTLIVLTSAFLIADMAVVKAADDITASQGSDTPADRMHLR